MSRWRFFLGDILICLPLGLLLSGGWYFFSQALPRFEEREAERIDSRYREIAATIRDGEAKGVRDYNYEPKTRRGKLSRGQWGVTTRTGRTVVWYHAPAAEKVRGFAVEALEPFDYRRFFGWLGGAILLLVLLLTNVGLRYFRRFTRERDDFLAAAAHDLTTPLVGMRMTIGRNDEEAKRLNERMLLIVSNIKDFLRLGGRRRKPDLKPVDISSLVREAYSLFAADYEEYSAVRLHLPPPPFSVLADETMLLQILWNLFGNDLKYAAPYGKVAVSVRTEGKRTIVEFADEGPGMTPRQMRRAFDRYYRAKTVQETGKGGFGIGLCTAREFARAMGGDLSVRENAPHGCVFTLALAYCQPKC